jgi:hypothetical protein
MRLKLETVSQISLILVSAIAAYTLVEPRFAKPKPTRIPIESLVNHTINLHAPWRENANSVAVALNSKCAFCMASVPFYRALDTMAHQAKGKLSLTIVSSEPTETVQRFLAEHGITADRVFAVPLPSTGVTATPSLFLVDSHGTIRAAFAGRLNPSQEEFLVQKLQEGA